MFFQLKMNLSAVMDTEQLDWERGQGDKEVVKERRAGR